MAQDPRDNLPAIVTATRYTTNRDLELVLWGARVTLPAGTRAVLVKGADGIKGDLYAVCDIALLIRLTGNSHDPKYRWAFLPDDAIKAEDMI